MTNNNPITNAVANYSMFEKIELTSGIFKTSLN